MELSPYLVVMGDSKRLSEDHQTHCSLGAWVKISKFGNASSVGWHYMIIFYHLPSNFYKKKLFFLKKMPTLFLSEVAIIFFNQCKKKFRVENFDICIDSGSI